MQAFNNIESIKIEKISLGIRFYLLSYLTLCTLKIIMEVLMRKITICVVILCLFSVLYSAQGREMRDLVANQSNKLQSILAGYADIREPSEEQIATFLEQYPEGVSFQRVFSNRQKSSLCGIYALQNSLWYRYVLGKAEIHGNELFQAVLASIDDPARSIFNGIEVESFDKLLQDKFTNGFGIVAFQVEAYAPLNAAGMAQYFGDAIGYVRDMIEQKTPIISLLINCSQGDTYGASDYRGAGAAQDNIPGHWVSVTIVQNPGKRVYLLADSLADEKGIYDQGHVGFVLTFLNEVEKDHKIQIIPEETAVDYQIPANSKKDERLRKEWLNQLSFDDIILKTKRLFAEKMLEKNIDKSIKDYIFQNCINPALEELDETSDRSLVSIAIRSKMTDGALDILPNPSILYRVIEEVLAVLEGRQTEFSQREEQKERFPEYKDQILRALNYNFVNNEEVRVVSVMEKNTAVKQFIVNNYIIPVLEQFERAGSLEELYGPILENIDNNFLAMQELLSLEISQNDLKGIIFSIMINVSLPAAQPEVARPLVVVPKQQLPVPAAANQRQPLLTFSPAFYPLNQLADSILNLMYPGIRLQNAVQDHTLLPAEEVDNEEVSPIEDVD